MQNALTLILIFLCFNSCDNNSANNTLPNTVIQQPTKIEIPYNEKVFIPLTDFFSGDIRDIDFSSKNPDVVKYVDKTASGIFLVGKGLWETDLTLILPSKEQINIKVIVKNYRLEKPFQNLEFGLREEVEYAPQDSFSLGNHIKTISAISTNPNVVKIVKLSDKSFKLVALNLGETQIQIQSNIGITTQFKTTIKNYQLEKPFQNLALGLENDIEYAPQDSFSLGHRIKTISATSTNPNIIKVEKLSDKSFKLVALSLGETQIQIQTDKGITTQFNIEVPGYATFPIYKVGDIFRFEVKRYQQNASVEDWRVKVSTNSRFELTSPTKYPTNFIVQRYTNNEGLSVWGTTGLTPTPTFMPIKESLLRSQITPIIPSFLGTYQAHLTVIEPGKGLVWDHYEYNGNIQYSIKLLEVIKQ